MAYSKQVVDHFQNPRTDSNRENERQNMIQMATDMVTNFICREPQFQTATMKGSFPFVEGMKLHTGDMTNWEGSGDPGSSLPSGGVFKVISVKIALDTYGSQEGNKMPYRLIQRVELKFVGHDDEYEV